MESRKENIHIDERIITLVDKAGISDEDWNKLKEAIILVFKGRNVSNLIPRLEVIVEKEEMIVGKRKSFFAWVSVQESLSKRYVIHVNKNRISKIHKIEIARNLLHEMVHLRHSFYENYEKSLKTAIRLKEALQKLYFKKTTSLVLKKKLLKDLQFFLRNLQVEGLAELISKVQAGRLGFDDLDVEKLWKDAKRTVEILNYFWKKIISRDIVDKNQVADFTKKLNKSAYYIGLHMAHTLFNYGYDEEELLEWKYIKFIRKYEKVMLSKGFQPVVSYRSGRGMFDYNQKVAEWWALYSKK